MRLKVDISSAVLLKLLQDRELPCSAQDLIKA
jgi:hypothetical protein